MKTILIIDAHGAIRREYLLFIPNTYIVWATSMREADKAVKAMLELPHCVVFTTSSVTEEWVADIFNQYSLLRPPNFISVAQSKGDSLAISLFLNGYAPAPIHPYDVGDALTALCGEKEQRFVQTQMSLVA